MKRPSVKIDVEKTIKQAWDVLWADNLKQRAEGNDFRGQTYFLTAADLVNQVRAFAEADIKGRERPAEKAYGGYGFGVRLSFNAQDAVRNWLLRQARNGLLESHNFGKGHISGMRFRPQGAPLTDAEKKTMASRAKRAARWSVAS